MRPMRDESGGIEGMPLQLMILVIVAGLVLAVVLGWTLSIQGPSVIKSVNVDPPSVDLGNIPEDKPASTTVNRILVTAYDAKNALVKDTTVTITGSVPSTLVRQDGEDGSDGVVTFPSVKVSLPPGVTVGELTLTIQKAGFPSKSWSIPVVRGA